jgi:hypothetical protein
VALPRTRALRLLAILALAAALVGAALGWLLVRGGERAVPIARPVAQPTSVNAGGLTLALPEGFSRDPGAPTLPGLDGPGTVRLRAYSRVLISPVQATGPTLLPAALVRRAQGQLPPPTVSRVGRLRVAAYTEVPGLSSTGLVNLYAVPTTRGTTVLACYGHPAAPYECKILLERMRLTEGRLLDPAGDAAFLQVLPGVVDRLDAQRRTARARLARAVTRQGRAAGARALADAYRQAADRLAPSVAAGRPPESTLRQLEALATDYRSLASASEARDREAYRRAAQDISSGEDQLARELARWRRTLASSGA